MERIVRKLMRLGNEAISFLKNQPLLLMIAFGNKAGFEVFNWAISLMFDAKYSFTANNIFVLSTLWECLESGFMPSLQAPKSLK